MTHTIESIIKKSAKSALFSWKQSEDGLDDLINDLWVWYLERPSTQQKLAESDEYLARRLVYKAALQILAGKSLVEDEFRGNNLYSPENIKDALAGRARNKFLRHVLPTALDALAEQNEGYAEAIRARYIDGTVPQDNASKQKLKYALKSLTKHVNIQTIEAGGADSTNHPGPKLRNPIDPAVRGSGGRYSDPTADIAIMLINNPELRDDYLEERSLQDFLRGASA